MTQAPTFRQAARQHTSILAAVEKRTLIWLAERLPAWVHSDHLTALGFLSLVAAGLAYWGRQPLLVIVLLALNWFGDSLDGTLARVRKRQRPRYGFYIDHVLDALGMTALMTGLAFSGYLWPAAAFAFLIAYLLLSIEIYLATYTIGTFQLSFWSFGPTELRILLAIGNLVLVWNPTAPAFTIGFAIGAAGVAAVTIQAVVKHTRQLYRAEAIR